MNYLVSIGLALILIMTAALIGFLYSRYFSDLRIKSLLSERDQLKKKFGDLSKTHQQQKEYADSLENDKLKLVSTNDELASKVQSLINQMAQSNTLLDVLQVKNTDLENQLDMLQTRNEVWENKNQENEKTIAQIKSEKSILEEQHQMLESESIELKQLLEDSRSNAPIDSTFNTQIQSLKDQLEAANNKNAAQHKEMQDLEQKYKELLSIRAPYIEEEYFPQNSRAEQQIKSILGARIKPAEPSEKDDLKRIKGVGEFMEKKLNKLGIYTFEQISQFDEELLNTITDAIDLFPGRILRDDWIGQASNLYQIKLDNPSEFRKTPPKSSGSSNNEDMKKITGIGPKISQILYDSGIHTCLQLAQTSVEQLSKILEKANITFKKNEIKTWPMQARLIAAGKWEELQSFKQQIKKGRK